MSEGNTSEELQNLLKAIDTVERYGYVYMVNITNPNFIKKHDYLALKYEKNVDDKKMNNIISNMSYNGIIYPINSFGLNKTKDFTGEYNVVIIDDKTINIKKIEKVEFTGILNINRI